MASGISDFFRDLVRDYFTRQDFDLGPLDNEDRRVVLVWRTLRREHKGMADLLSEVIDEAVASQRVEAAVIVQLRGLVDAARVRREILEAGKPPQQGVPGVTAPDLPKRRGRFPRKGGSGQDRSHQ